MLHRHTTFFLNKKRRKKNDNRESVTTSGIRLQRQTPPKRLHSWPRDFLHEVVCRVFFFFMTSTSLFAALTFSNCCLNYFPAPKSSSPASLRTCRRHAEVRWDTSVTLKPCNMKCTQKNSFPFKKSWHSIHTPCAAPQCQLCRDSR